MRSLAVVDSVIKRSTSNGDGFLRYNLDGYGDRSTDGRPWAPTGQGNGHLWPVLAGERGQFELDSGNVSAAVARLQAMRGMASGVGLIPEQAWDAPDLAASFGRETAPFKRDVRKLKELGLTISLEVGYELSPRGRAYLEKTKRPR